MARPTRITAALAAVSLAGIAIAAATGSGAALAARATAARGAKPARPASVPTNIDATPLSGNQAEQTVAVDPKDTDNIVVLANAPSGLVESWSHDGGKTWTQHTFTDACCDPSLSYDQFGNLFMAYLYASLPDSVPVFLSTDDGDSFTLLGSVSTRPLHGRKTGPGRGTAFADQPTISTGAGSVWVTYTTTGDSHVVAAGAKVRGFGDVGKLHARQEVPGTNGVGDYGDIQISPSGKVVVSYQNPTGGQGPADLWTAVDPDGLGPKGFNTPKLLTVTNVGGFDYIPAQSGRSVDAEFNLAYDRTGGPHNGRLYAIWLSENPDESNNMDVMFQYSDDNTKTWSTAVRVNDDGGTNSQFNPAIALDQSTGNIGIAWFDCRKDHGTGGKGDTDGVPNDDAQFWGTWSTDGGQTFAKNIQISKGTSNAADAHSGVDYGDFTHVAFAGGLFFPLWSDNSNSTGTNPDGKLHAFDIYLAIIPVS
jgi:hypothetical protein